MPKTARSARGDIVDFDVIMIKNELANAQPSIEVAARQEFIESKMSPRRDPVKPMVIGRDSGHVGFDSDFSNDNEDEGEDLSALNIPTSADIVEVERPANTEKKKK